MNIFITMNVIILILIIATAIFCRIDIRTVSDWDWLNTDLKKLEISFLSTCLLM